MGYRNGVRKYFKEKAEKVKFINIKDSIMIIDNHNFAFPLQQILHKNLITEKIENDYFIKVQDFIKFCNKYSLKIREQELVFYTTYLENINGFYKNILGNK